MTDEFIASSLPRYGRTPRNLLREPRVSMRAKVLYALLDDYAGADGKAFPSRALLAASLACSVSAVAKALAELERWGWLLREHRFREDGSQTSTLYTLGAGRDPVDVTTGGGGRVDTPPVSGGTHQEGEPLEGELPPQPPASGGRANPSDADGALIPVADVGAVGHTGNMNKPVATRSSRREVPDTDPDFSAFWDAYPRKVGKGAARKAWLKAVKRAGSARVVIDGAERFAREVAAQQKVDRDQNRGRNTMEFVPYPATWLNGERWSDAVEPGKTKVDMRIPPKRDEECPIHAGQWAARCSGCAADRLAKE